MARDEISVLLPEQDETAAVELVKVTKKAVTQANGIQINNAMDNKNNSLQITVENTATAATEVTLKAGDAYPNACLGDLVVAVAGSSAEVILLEDPSQFENKDGSILVDFKSGFTGNIYAVAKRAGLKPVE